MTLTKEYDLVATQKIGKYTVSVRWPKPARLTEQIVTGGYYLEPAVNTVLTDEEFAKRCLQCPSGKWRNGILRCSRQKCRYN